MSRFGFGKPNEHGLIAIFVATVTLGSIESFGQTTDWVGYICVILLAASVFFGYETIAQMKRDRRATRGDIPVILSILCSSLLILAVSFTQYVFVTFAILGTMTAAWAISTLRGLKTSYMEITLGAAAMSLQYLLMVTVAKPITTTNGYLAHLAIWWMFLGVVEVIIIQVGCLRGKLSHATPIVVWLILLLSFVPMFLLRFLNPIIIVCLIEPTYRAAYQWWSKQTMKSKNMSIKRVGWSMVLSLTMYILIITVIVVMQVPIVLV